MTIKEAAEREYHNSYYLREVSVKIAREAYIKAATEWYAKGKQEKGDFEILPIDQAPKDGDEIIGIYKDGTEEMIRWNEDRYCMLGRRNGSFPPGWSSANPKVDSNLPLDDNEIFAFKRTKNGLKKDS